MALTDQSLYWYFQRWIVVTFFISVFLYLGAVLWLAPPWVHVDYTYSELSKSYAGDLLLIAYVLFLIVLSLNAVLVPLFSLIYYVLRLRVRKGN